jgi:hypothetical protein
MAYILIRYLDIVELARIFSRASLPYLFLSCLCTFMVLFGKAHRLHYFLGKSSIRTDFFGLASTYTYANLVGQFSNILVSDVINAGALMMGRAGKIRITNIFLLNRIVDLGAILLLFSVFLFVHYPMIKGYVHLDCRPIFILAAVCLILLPFLVSFRRKVACAGRDLVGIALETKGASLVYLIVIYSFNCLSFWCDGRALRIEASPGMILLAAMFGSLITVLPLSVAGIGTRDILYIFLLALVGIGPESAVALSSLSFLIIPCLSLSLLFAVSFLGRRYEYRRNG